MVPNGGLFSAILLLVKDHKSLLAWQRAHAVVLRVLHACKSHWQPWASALFGQLQRSALSVQLNIAEGYAVKMPGRLRYHFTIAYGSAVETTDLLELMQETKLLPSELATPTLADARQTQALLLGLLKRTRQGGP